MDILDRHELDQILASEGGPHVTIYLPAPERPVETKNDAIRIANLIRDAHSTLNQYWMPAAQADRFLKPLDDLSRDSEFLAERRHGVAIYLSTDVFKIYRISESFYPDTRTLKELHHVPTGDPGDPSHDLIEVAVVHTLRHGGHVHRVSTEEMPVESKMAAALRY